MLTKLIVLGLGVLGSASLWLAIAADTGACIVVILNSMRLLGNQPIPGLSGVAEDALPQRFGLSSDNGHQGPGH